MRKEDQEDQGRWARAQAKWFWFVRPLSNPSVECPVASRSGFCVMVTVWSGATWPVLHRCESRTDELLLSCSLAAP